MKGLYVLMSVACLSASILVGGEVGASEALSTRGIDLSSVKAKADFKKVISLSYNIGEEDIKSITEVKSKDIVGASMLVVHINKGSYSEYRIFYVSKSGTLFSRPKMVISSNMSNGVIAKNLDIRKSTFDASILKEIAKTIELPFSGNKYASDDETIYELIDFQCPACKMSYHLMKDWHKSNPRTKVVYVHYPLSIHPYAPNMSIMVQLAYNYNKKLGIALMDRYLSIPADSPYDIAMPSALRSLLSEMYSSSQSRDFMEYAEKNYKKVASELEIAYKKIGFVPSTPTFVSPSGDIMEPSLKNGAIMLR